MSYVQFLGQMGGSAPVRLSGDLISDVVRQVGQVFEYYSRGENVNCTCWNLTYKVFDRKCSLCGGSGLLGGLAAFAKGVFMGIMLSRSEGSQDQHQRIHAKPGPIDTFDAMIICAGKWFNVIHNEDVLVWKQRGTTEGIELKVIGVLPRLGMDNEVVFVRLDITRNPFRMLPEANDLKEII